MPITAAASSSSQYHLDLQPQKENVFVTQLNDRSENDDIRRFPIVKDSADKLLQSGINTLQSTSLLRQAVDVEHVDRELAEKREEFRQRMEVCKAKEEALKMKQQKIKERVTKFDRFLKENEAKRNRALKKYQQEVKNNKLKSRELSQLNRELETLTKQRESLKRRLVQNKIYESYLMRVIDILPEDYLEMGADSVIQGVIQRHEGLSATNEGLLDRNHSLISSIENGQRELDDLRQETNKLKLVFNSELASLQKVKEKLLQKNKILEQQAANSHENKRRLIGELGQILMGIDNLAQEAHRRHWPAITNMTYTQKLSMVQEFFLERVSVEKSVRAMMVEAEINATNSNSIGRSSIGNTKSLYQFDNDRSYSRKQVLPPIGKSTITAKKAPVPSSGQVTKSSTNFLERLTAISESHAEL
uniref:coiled-coil domain-containing protein 42 homolog n=1 Tax=Styela clava TaxID=7725 RepID=UPI00193A488C|nr:coiled-coil domain-containing protein 42 homolog [Styela clava]